MSDAENFEIEILKWENNQLDQDDDWDDDYDDDYWDDYDDWEERREEELQERAAYCTCGAWQNTPSGVVHVADCCCGAE